MQEWQRGQPPLCVHLGKEEHAYINKSLFSRHSDEMERQILTDCSEVAAKFSCSYKKWVGDCGLLGCKNQATADYLRQVTASIELDSQSFCAWPKEELGKLESLTFYIPNFSHLSAGHPVLDHLTWQNDLPGGYMYSFQEVKSKNNSRMQKRGWYYLIRVVG